MLTNYITKSFDIIIYYLQVTVLIIYREKQRELQWILDDHFNQLLHNRQLKNIILEKITSTRQLKFVVLIFCSIVSAIYIVTPMIFIVNQCLQHVKNVEYIHPYPAIYPFSILFNGLIYKLIYIYEIFTILTVLVIFWGTQPLDSQYTYFKLTFN